MNKVITKGKYDGAVTLVLLVATFLPYNFLRYIDQNRNERYWIDAYTRILLFSFAVGFAVSASRQPESGNKFIGRTLLGFIIVYLLFWLILGPAISH